MLIEWIEVERRRNAFAQDMLTITVSSGVSAYCRSGMPVRTAIGELANLMLGGQIAEHLRTSSSSLEWFLSEHQSLVHTLRLTPLSDNCLVRCGWSIVNGDRFIDRLTFDEALGFVARLEFTGDESFQVMKTYEQWLQCNGPYYAVKQPVALIGA